MVRRSLLAAGSVLLCILAPAQPLAAQLGKPTGTTFDARARLRLVTGFDYTLFGVALDVNGDYWVTAQRATATGKHKLFKFNATGAYRAEFDQPAATDASPSGIYDLAYDEVANVLYGGCEHAASGQRVFAFDVGAGRFDATRDWVVPAAAPGLAVRALAYDRFGNGAQGTLWAADLGSAVYEFTRTGTLLRQFASVNPQATGAAIDATERVVWWVGQAGTARANCKLAAVAMDVTTGTPTGQVFLGDLAIPGTPPGGLAAGCEFYVHDETDHFEPRIVLVAQAQSHHVYEVMGRFNQGTGCGGRIGFRGDAPFEGNNAFTLTLTGSAATNAFVLVSVQSTILPLPVPLFGSGCYLLASLAVPSLVVGPVPVQSGAASIGVPIPLGVARNDLFWQWLEAAPSAPLLLSDGGGMYLFP